MSVKAFSHWQLPCHLLLLIRLSHRPVATCLSLFFFTALLFVMQPVPVAQAAENAVLCALSASDEASLSQAINCINTGGAGTHTITLTSDILLTQPLPVLTNPTATEIVLEGNNHTLDANGTGRVLTIEQVQNLTLRNITLTGGQTDVNGLSPNGGGLSLVCGEDLDCNWTLLNTVVRNNQAAAGGGILYRCDYHGGGSLLVQDSVIRGNVASGAGGGLIYSSDEESGFCSVTLRNTLLEGNRAAEGGAFRILRPRVTIVDSTIRDNVATENGGGILARISDGFIDMTIRNTTISGNQAGQNGGGLYIESPEQTFEIALVNSTVSGNSATTGAGGGLYLGESNDSLRIALINSTVTQNTAAQGAGVHVFHLDSGFEMTGTLRLTNSIVADNLGSDCGGEVAGGGLFSGERVTSFGHNLDSDGTCLTPSVRQGSDIPSSNANLGPLADNGGPTLTHALGVGSAALDAADNAVCAADPVGGVDQRGAPRPQGAHCDIGAYERPALAACPYPNLVASDEASLRQAIDCVNVADPGAYTITLLADIVYTQPMFRIHNPAITSLLITGNGHTIDAQGHGRVLALYKSKVDMRDLTLRGGRLPKMDIWPNPNYGGGIYADTENIGFAVEPSCALTLTNVVLTDNEAYAGGGLYYSCELPLRMSHTTISNNRAVFGGAFSTSAGEEFSREVFVNSSTFSGNEATSNGGAFDLANGDGGIFLQLVNSTVSGNQAVSGNGGGLFLTQAADDGRSEVQVINSTIANNTATAGSGVYDHYGILSMSNSIIAHNSGGSNCVLVISEYNDGRFTSNGHNLDNDGSCLPAGVRQPSDIPSGNANLGPLADNGGPTLTHALLAGSQAIDAGDDAVCAATPVSGVDQRGVTRPQGVHCDIGAYEAVAQAAGNVIFVSATSSGKAGGVKFRDEDILAYDPTTDSWLMIFDGSDVGVTKDVDAFNFRPDGSLLLSFNGATTVPGLGHVDDSDIVRFIPTALGDNTTGTFDWYLHGADVGLTTDGEDIDAIGFTADGYLVVSTIGNFDAPNAAGRDEDLFQLNNATFGNPSSGTWSPFFDGSTVGLANEDINGLWIDPAQPDLYLTVKDSFAFAGQDVDGNDIFVCTLTQAGGCTYRLFWDGDQHGTSAKHLNGVGLGALPATFNPTVQVNAAEQAIDVDAATDDDSDDLDVAEENIGQIFLPLINR